MHCTSSASGKSGIDSNNVSLGRRPFEAGPSDCLAIASAFNNHSTDATHHKNCLVSSNCVCVHAPHIQAHNDHNQLCANACVPRSYDYNIFTKWPIRGAHTLRCCGIIASVRVYVQLLCNQNAHQDRAEIRQHRQQQQPAGRQTYKVHIILWVN